MFNYRLIYGLYVLAFILIVANTKEFDWKIPVYISLMVLNLLAAIADSLINIAKKEK